MNFIVGSWKKKMWILSESHKTAGILSHKKCPFHQRIVKKENLDEGTQKKKQVLVKDCGRNVTYIKKLWGKLVFQEKIVKKHFSCQKIMEKSCILMKRKKEKKFCLRIAKKYAIFEKRSWKKKKNEFRQKIAIKCKFH